MNNVTESLKNKLIDCNSSLKISALARKLNIFFKNGFKIC